MSSPKESEASIRAVPFDYGYEQPFNTEFYLQSQREALLVRRGGWACGACYRPARIERDYQPTCCANENCQIQWTHIIIENGLKKFPSGFDFLPVVGRSAVDINGAIRKVDRSPGASLTLGNRTLKIVTHTEANLGDNSSTQDEIAPIENR